MKTVMIALAAGLALSPVAAFAQQGGGALSACTADIQKYCEGKTPRTPEMRACIQENSSKFSDECKKVLAEMRAKAAQGGGQ